MTTSLSAAASSLIVCIVLLVAIFGGAAAGFLVRINSTFNHHPSALATTTTLLQSYNTKMTTQKKNKINPLDGCIQEGIRAGYTTILIVDTNNVRGKDDFQTWNCDLLTQLACYRRTQLKQSARVNGTVNDDNDDSIESSLLQIIYAVDHGCSPQVQEYDDDCMSIVFAGPHRTADDVIAQATRFLVSVDDDNEDNDDAGCKENTTKKQVVVVTSDGELRQRCLRCASSSSSSSSSTLANELGNKGKGKRQQRKRITSDFASVKVFGSPALVSSLQDMMLTEAAAAPLGGNDNTTSSSSSSSSNNVPTEPCRLLQELERVESDIRWYTALHPPFQSGAEQQEAQKHGPWKSTLLRPHDATAAVLFPRTPFQEATWHRILVAEMMQTLWERRSGNERQQQQRRRRRQPILSQYRSFYEQQQVDNRSGTPVDTLFLDHRIRNVPYLQAQLLKYLQTSIDSLLTVETANNDNDGRVRAKTLESSPKELAVKIMKQLVLESPQKTQNEILLRYMKEAPEHLQTSRLDDLKDLLKRIAVREQRPDDIRPRWYLLADDNDVAWDFQPRRGRRSEKRMRTHMEQSGQVDEELVAMGRSIETQWRELIQWRTLESTVCGK